MRFLIDRCAGRKLAEWLNSRGHDVIESRTLGPDPGDQQMLKWAWEQERILVTIDTDFGGLVYLRGAAHRGIVRLPDVPARGVLSFFLPNDAYTFSPRRWPFSTYLKIGLPFKTSFTSWSST